MARTESEQLVFTVEARIAAMEKQMARASRVTDKTMTGIERRGKTMTGRMEKEMAASASRITGLMKGLGAGFLGGLAAGGIAGIVTQFGEVAKSVADIGREAKTSGLAMREFQEWKYVAEQARIPVDAMTDAFKELNLRADEFATTGKGSAAEAFQRLGLSQEEVKKRLADPSALLLEIIDRTKRLGDTAAGIRIFDGLLGGQGGEKFVQLIDRGADGIRDSIKEAHNLGAVMTDEVIKSAEELDLKFNQVATTVGTSLKSTIVGAAQALSNFISIFQDFENRGTENLQSQLNFLEKTLRRLRKPRAGLAACSMGLRMTR
ncbi:hypothetical protein DUT91_03485 [Phyllobacterium salinisoli]|uniref:Phage tail tape measure protein n=1 Tax=Phyllobacterium salinisoli TaxID=1899321 RepID=A0A368K9D5_9HYPH|nr:hypothetical protein [Phyllobacterium salinisoli]RCS25834.1 hypothetical protein DUT91_03485 [Phyllobacterium salinisoli]